MDLVREVVSLALSARKTAGVSVRQPLRAIAFDSTRLNGVRLSSEHLGIILEELNVKQFEDYETLVELSKRRGEVQVVVSQGRIANLLIDTLLTEELKLEGSARELERAIQDLRKKSGLKVGDMVELYYNTTDTDLEKVLLELVDRKKTFVSSIAQSFEVEADEEVQAVISGGAIWLGLVKV
jgi:hypothetical protein